MIYLHSYKNDRTEITHDFYNHVDNTYYSVSITNRIRYYKVNIEPDLGTASEYIDGFQYTLPEKLYYKDVHNNKTRYEDLTDSKLRISLNSI